MTAQQWRAGWWQHARQVLTTHFDARPDVDDVSLLVIHNISLPPGEFGTPFVEAFFTGQLDPHAHPYFESIAHLRVSAHFFIRRSGEVLQFVPITARAWHAGVSSFEGRERCNDFSIGIELEGCDDKPFDDAQYAALVTLTHALQQVFPRLTSARITGHQDIAPTRKTDPGPFFDWLRYRRAL